MWWFGLYFASVFLAWQAFSSSRVLREVLLDGHPFLAPINLGLMTKGLKEGFCMRLTSVWSDRLQSRAAKADHHAATEVRQLVPRWNPNPTRVPDSSLHPAIIVSNFMTGASPTAPVYGSAPPAARV